MPAGRVRNRFGDFAVQAGNRFLTVAARLRLLLIQRELPSRDREGAVLTGEEFPKMVKHPRRPTGTTGGPECAIMWFVPVSSMCCPEHGESAPLSTVETAPPRYLSERPEDCPNGAAFDRGIAAFAGSWAAGLPEDSPRWNHSRRGITESTFCANGVWMLMHCHERSM